MTSVKLLAAFLCCAAVFSVLASVSRATKPPSPKRGALELCRSGAVELNDERCATLGGCASQFVRLTWEQGEGVLVEGDSVGERELRRIQTPELSRLLRDLSSLEPIRTDSDLQCGPHGCPPTDRALTITTTCGPASRTFTFMRARPAWDRVRSDCARHEGPELARCTAERAWQAAFATNLAARFGTVFQQLRGG